MDAIKEGAKSLAAVVTAAVTAFLTGPVLDQAWAVVIAATSVVTGIVVWIVKNKPQT